MKTTNVFSSFIGSLVIAFAITLFMPSASQADWGKHDEGSSSSKCDSSSSSGKSHSSSSKGDSSSSGKDGCDPKKCDKYKDLADKYLKKYHKSDKYKYYEKHMYYIKKYEQCQSADPDTCSECDGKVTNLTLKYNASVDATIEVSARKGGVIFHETVSGNGEFTLNGFDKKGTLGTEISIYINGVLNTKIHTSCSNPIAIGMDFGDFTIIDGYSRNGGQLCPVEGYQKTGNVCGTVYEDINDNKQQDTDEFGVAGVAVTIIDAASTIHNLTTDNSGNYCQDNVPEGSATIEIDETTLPADGQLTAGVNPNTITVETNKDNDAGTDGYTITIPVGNICGQVILDGNGLEGVTLNITDDKDNVHPATTGTDGNWCANGLPEGDATVDVDESTLPAGVERTLGEDQDIYPIIDGENTDAGIDGYETPATGNKTGSVTGFVYLDINGNGTFNAQDRPFPSVPVAITIDGQTFETITGTDGKYTRDNIPVGEATVTIDESYIITNYYPDIEQTAGINPSPVTVVENILTDAGEDGYDPGHGIY